MKKLNLVLIVALSLGFLGQAEAKIRKETLNSNEPMTAEKLFLNQVDTVCLYLATERIVYVPKLKEDMKLAVTITFLDVVEVSPSDKLRNFFLRYVHTFQKTLKERMGIYTPELAKEFDEKKDIAFTIQAGGEHRPVAQVAEGEWFWLEAAQSSNASGTPAASDAVCDCKRKCPAWKGAKEQVKIEIEQPTDIQQEPQPEPQPEQKKEVAPAPENPEPEQKKIQGEDFPL